MDKWSLTAAILTFYLIWCSAQFVDEYQVYEERCLGNDKFQCLDGECISQQQYCNGHLDCKDGSDESFCPGEHHIDVKQCERVGEYPCLDGTRCIPYTWICNNNTDCRDGSDEMNCTSADIVPKHPESCKGFTCDQTKCISMLWVCDGAIDCKDKTDEDVETQCRKAKSVAKYVALDGRNCDPLDALLQKQYTCNDKSFCLPDNKMCDGIDDCKDGSDEGLFCRNWHTMCTNSTCGGGSKCYPDRDGPTCYCDKTTVYSKANNSCVDIDECSEARPKCSQRCLNFDGKYKCACDPGYHSDRFHYLCFASGPDPLLFFATHNDIRFFNVKSRQQITVVKNLKEAHGVAYDGTFIYWVENAKGHQAIVRAKMDNVEKTKQILLAIGLEDPGDIAIDWITQLFYFTDAERGIIAACHQDGSICTVLITLARHPKFVTLNPPVGDMYWADWHDTPVIMHAKMDGSEAKIFLDDLADNPTGLTLDIPNERLYYVDRGVIRVTRLDRKGGYVLLDETANHPFSLAVFENTVYWSDWSTNTLQACDKVYPPTRKRKVLASLDAPVFGVHLYHPVLMSNQLNACHNNDCSDMCLLNGNGTYSCACAEGRKLVDRRTCAPVGYRDLPQFLIVGGGPFFTRIRYNSLGNPESRASTLDIGRVQAMAYNSFKRILYMYDGERKTINQIDMNDFSRGITRLLEYKALADVVDMDYDYVADALYFVDAERRFLEVLSIRTNKRAIIYRFRDQEIPVSICVLPEYGQLLVAVIEEEFRHEFHIDSMGLDGEGRKHIVKTGLKGPRVRLRYVADMDNVYVSDEGNGVINYMHPTGTGKEKYRELSTTVASLAVSDTTVFWTDRRTPRLFWSGIHETGNKIRRLELTIFPNDTQIHLQSTFPPPDLTSPLMQHPCFKGNPCSHVCVQVIHPTHFQGPVDYSTAYRCLCPPGMVLQGNKCENLALCQVHQIYCHANNTCADGKRCDGRRDCPNGEDEINCEEMTDVLKCSPEEKLCDGICVFKNYVCKGDVTKSNKTVVNDSEKRSNCTEEQFQCVNDASLCVQRWQLCDSVQDCPDGSDEGKVCQRFSCLETEFMCASRTCIIKSWHCDGDPDCPDASDEAYCENKTCKYGDYQCRSGECIERDRVCNGQQDCTDYSDEIDCSDEIAGLDEPKCGDNEYTCQFNRSICLPLSARCNTKVDCPGATDESDCDTICSASSGLFQCEQEDFCISKRFLCDGVKNCRDGSDESPFNCKLLSINDNNTISIIPHNNCVDGYQCAAKQCVEWKEVCDNKFDCNDRSDENGLCSTACANNTCEYMCQPTPVGHVCLCPVGYSLDATTNSCTDIDECNQDLCSQKCQNVPGSFVCSCYYGYALRSNRRTCKAIKNNMSIMYVSGNSVRTVTTDGYVTPVYNDPNVAAITDLDYYVRSEKLYVTSPERGELTEVNATNARTVLTNVGRPTKVAVEWITGNIYFVDSTPEAQRFRVCNLRKKRCAVLQSISSGAKVTALVLDPANKKMFYCLSHSSESVVWSASLDGHNMTDLAPVRNCTGLALDTYKQYIFVSEVTPSHIFRMTYEGTFRKLFLYQDPTVQLPHTLQIYEDHIYFLVANSFKLGRCNLHGKRRCEPFSFRVFDASTFVLKHEGVQRHDIENACDGFPCENICVLGENGPLCLCDDGTRSVDGKDCKALMKADMPLFDGWTAVDLERAQQASVTVVIVLLVMVFSLLLIYLVYHLIYKKKRNGNPLTVRFQNMPSQDNSPGDPTIEIPTSSTHREFVNPLQFMQGIWNRSFRMPNHPVGTAGLSIKVPPQEREDNSDSDLDVDVKDTRSFFK